MSGAIAKRGMQRVFAVGIAAVLAAGCGAASPNAPASAPTPPPSEASMKSAYPQQAQPSATMAPPAAGAAPAPVAPMAPPAPAPASPRDEAEAPAPAASTRARSGDRELEAAERGVASSDCPTACRALGSMERAVVFICVSNQGDDAAHCGDAKVRLVSARRRVRATCGECPSGPSVDPDAPVPSRR